MNSNLDHETSGDLERDALIARLVDDDASEQDWRDFESRAGADQSLWRLVAMAQRDQMQLFRLGRTMDAIADRVALPVPARKTLPLVEVPPRPGSGFPLAGWLGWAVAACVFVALILNTAQSTRPVDHAAPGVVTAGWNAQEAFDAYLEKGQAEGSVLSTAPRRVIVETRPNPSGDGYELIYLQQVMERAIVPNLYQVNGRDEQGRPSLAPYHPETVGRM